MQFARQSGKQGAKGWPSSVKDKAVRQAAQRIGERAVNRAAQLIGPVLIVADGTLRSLRKINYGEE